MQKYVKFECTESCQRAFEEIKNITVSDQVLTHFDSKLPIIVTTDASEHGIAAVMAHKMPSDEDKPICYFSRTLSKAETTYSLAIY